jgi:hypothetical protein
MTFPKLKQVAVCPGEDHVKVTLMKVGRKQPDDVWVPFLIQAFVRSGLAVGPPALG